MELGATSISWSEMVGVRRDERGLLRMRSEGGIDIDARYGSSARTRSSIEAKRSFGFFWSARVTAAATSDGSSGAMSVRGSGSFERIMLMTETAPVIFQGAARRGARTRGRPS
jgi:hypothetical protein